MDPVIQKAYQASQQGKSFAFATIVETSDMGTPRHSGAKLVFLSDGSVYGTIGGGLLEQAVIKACQRALSRNKPELLSFSFNKGAKEGLCGGKMTVFVEPFAQTRHLVLCGGGHIGSPLSLMAKMLNLKVTVIDHRREYTNKKRFPHVDTLRCGSYVQQLKGILLDENTYVFIATPEHRYDLSCLKAVVTGSAAYIGLIASRTKRDLFLRELKKAKVPLSKIKRISSPAGLDVGSETPEEIAVAVMAEIVSIYNRQKVGSQKFTSKKPL